MLLTRPSSVSLTTTTTTTALRTQRRPLRTSTPHRRVLVRADTEATNTTETTTPPPITTTDADAAAPASDSTPWSAVDTSLRNGDAAQQQEELVFVPPTDGDRTWTSLKLAFALPWRRFTKGSVLSIDLEGSLSEKLLGRFSPGLSLPILCACLRKAALDPRIVGVTFKIGPLGLGWGKLQEIRRHIEYFNASGKFSIAYIERGGEKEYFLASACTELYIPPTAQLSLRGFTVTGTFLRGTLDKLGVEPQVKRIGEYKSAGDQLLREDMSEAQREQLTALLEDITEEFCKVVAASRKDKSPEDVRALLDAGVYDMQVLKDGGWVTDLKYADEIEELLKSRTGGKDDEVAAVPIAKYQNVSASAFVHGAKKGIAVIRAAGAIVGGSSSGNVITQGEVIRQLRIAKKNKNISAVVLRVDSPGGDALASDLMWREIVALAEKKPVIASMADVAASGGYYMSMAARAIVAEPLTITGSIGVVTGKFNLADAYQKLGYNKVLISEGKYAQLLADNRSFTDEEQRFFDQAAEFAYESFRNRAAESRGMAVEDMQKVAQGRVWSGSRASEAGLVDVLGGINRAILLAKEAAGIPLSERVKVLELSRGRPSPLALLSGSGASMQLLLPLLQQVGAGEVGGARAVMGLALAVGLSAVQEHGAAGHVLAMLETDGSGRPRYVMPDFRVDGAGSSSHK